MSEPSPRPPELLLLWHMHQPAYRLPGDLCAQMPWVRLHAAKSYLDMADALHRHPEMRAVVNFSGILLRQWRECLELGATDEEERLSLRPAESLELDERRHILTHFFSAHDRVVARFPRWLELREEVRRLGVDEAARTLPDGAITDLQVLFNLGWAGFCLRRTVPALKQLEARARDFTHDDVVTVVRAHRKGLRLARDRWAELLERGQVELSVTPMYHPILPLVIDSESARACMPGVALPPRYARPDHARWHVERALEEAEQFFGCRPVGVWPAEGSVSPAAARVFAECGVRWIASDEAVLAGSALDIPAPDRFAAGPWRLDEATRAIDLFVRDHELSDRVGFVYASWDAQAAADDVVERLRGRAGDGLVACILDGENAWESYADDGCAFLDALYRSVERAGVRTVLPRERVSDPPLGHVSSLATGSWIDANFRIWIGSARKNLAWSQLGQVVAELDAVGALSEPSVAECVHMAEGSDWFWWYGDDFASVNDGRFDALFRGALRRARSEAGLPPRRSLDTGVHGVVEREAKRHPPTLVAAPTIDGRATDYYEWMGAEAASPLASGGAMAMHGRGVSEVLWGRSGAEVFVRVALREDAPCDRVRVRVRGAEGERTIELVRGAVPAKAGAHRACWGELVEVALRVDGGSVELRLELWERGAELDALPRSGWVGIEPPGVSERAWFV